MEKNKRMAEQNRVEASERKAVTSHANPNLKPIGQQSNIQKAEMEEVTNVKQGVQIKSGGVTVITNVEEFKAVHEEVGNGKVVVIDFSGRRIRCS